MTNTWVSLHKLTYVSHIFICQTRHRPTDRTAVIPGPLTLCDDIEVGSGAGIKTILQWGQGERSQAVIDGWPQRIRGGYDSDEDSYEWDS